jgi:hypothetical protein
MESELPIFNYFYDFILSGVVVLGMVHIIHIYHQISRVAGF